MMLVAIITNRVLLIDYAKPVRLETVLQPNLIQWNAYETLKGIDKLPNTFIYNRNTNQYVLDEPGVFMEGGDGNKKESAQVTKILTAGPPSLANLLASEASMDFFKKYNIRPIMEVRETVLYKRLFATLYKPSELLKTEFTQARKELGLQLNSKYIGMHVRYGNEGSAKAVVRYSDKGVAAFIEVGKALKEENMKGFADEDIPFVVVADEQGVKDRLLAMDPLVRINAKTPIVHEDRSRIRTITSTQIAAVWTDILLMVESECLVMSSSELSLLASRLATSDNGQGCNVLQKDGWIYEQSRNQRKLR
eukprot:CAMPEP_0202453136 /NCGR_PEP_ID=MMETSP1360-20130828/11170_1 /ASSEMBLY_ACC=CAM_ASM_000848 /TAXON_ID=515479 /ORGANISM="Licmophora paradoxa, Strain CCMP2313" /LENGTH=306 /DNA_ID=CAMNT_0049072137 /DNA_START=197 /DNA_END=1117 /DNA_ORIENTATION=-